MPLITNPAIKKQPSYIVKLALLVFIYTNCTTQQSFEEIMKRPIASLNKTSGQMIDRETRFDSGSIRGNNIFEYYYTTANYDRSELNVAGLKRDTEPVLKERVIKDADSSFQILKDYRATIKYHYSDKNGNTLFEITIRPNDYLQER